MFLRGRLPMPQPQVELGQRHARNADSVGSSHPSEAIVASSAKTSSPTKTPPPGDHHRRARLLHRVRLEDRVLGVKISPVESGSPLRPQRQDEADGLLHLPNTYRGAG